MISGSVSEQSTDDAESGGRQAQAALFAAILAHDTIHPQADLPAALHLDYDADQLARCFHLSRRLWETPGDTRRLRAIVATIIRTGRVAEDQKTAFKHIRARYKQLRFAYVIFDDRHRYPRALDGVTKLMSHVQDALVLGRRRAVRGYAIALRILLGGAFSAIVARELAGFRPTTARGFQEYVRRDIARGREAVARGRMTGSQFHATRKIISRQAALYDCLRVLYPSAYHDRIARYISTINGLMGAAHDDIVARTPPRSHGYETEQVEVPERITVMLTAFAALHRPPA
ncbi:MAG TPA: hypothetical protein VGC10_06255 [Sphingomonas sp.]